MADANFADVVLLLHCDGADGSTTWPDSSPLGLTVTLIGQAQISTAASRFGGASTFLDGVNDDIRVAAVDAGGAFDFGTGAWTAECWAMMPTTVTGRRQVFDFAVTSFPTTFALNLFVQGRTVGFDIGGYTGTPPTTDSGSLVMQDGVWHHLAWTYDGTTLRGFLDGELRKSLVFSIPVTTSRPCRIGRDIAGNNDWSGYFDEIRITKGVCRYTTSFTPPTEPFPDSGGVSASVEVASPLGAFLGLSYTGTVALAACPSPLGAARLTTYVLPQLWASVASPLGFGGARAWALHDFTAALVDSPERCTADLITPDGPVRVPISSWQATVQTGFKDYGQCVIPACAPYLDIIDDATEIVIYRRGLLTDGRYLDACVVRVPLQTAAFAQSPRSFTATLSGYADAYTLEGIPPFSGRTLPGVQSVFTSAAGRRVRGQLDWLIRPGHVVQAHGSPLTVAYINFTAGPNALFMDLGERSEA